MIASQTFRDFVWLSALSIAALFLVNLPQIIDPFVRHDDFPALLGLREMAYEKALEEGRWLNYWWQFRPVLWPANVHLALYLVAWGLLAATVPLAVLDRSVGNWYKGYLALFVALAIPAFLISHWFNTLLPGMWIVTLHAISVIALPHALAVALLVVTVPLTFMAYPTLPFILLALVLLSRKAPERISAATVTLGVFFAGLALALLLVYSLNFLFFDVFGIPIAKWRGPTQASSAADMAMNLAKFKFAILDSLTRLGRGSLLYGAALPILFVISWVALLFQQRRVALLIFVAAMVGIAPLVQQSLASGVRIPLRATAWLWILAGTTLTWLAFSAQRDRRILASVTRILMVSVLLLHVMFITEISFGRIPIWQKTTRALATAIPAGTETIYILGHYEGLDGAQSIGIQYGRALQLRLTYLTGAEAVICHETPEKCVGINPPFEPGSWVTAPRIETAGRDAFVLLPQPNAGP